MARKKNKCNSGHRLYPVNNGQIYDCNGCKTKGVGPTYRCDACDFYLHPECMNSTDTISPDIFQGQHLKFSKRPPPPANQKSREAKDFSPSVCSACGMQVKGFVYHSKETGIYLHPRCALLKAEIPLLAPAAAAVDHPAMKLILKKKKSKYCQLCQSAKLKSAVGEKIPGWYYSCIDDGGGEHAGCHVHCLMKLISETSPDKMKLVSETSPDKMKLVSETSPDKMKEGGDSGRVRSHSGSGSSGSGGGSGRSGSSRSSGGGSGSGSSKSGGSGSGRSGSSGSSGSGGSSGSSGSLGSSGSGGSGGSGRSGSGRSGSEGRGVSPENFTNRNPIIYGLRIFNEPNGADI